MITLRKLGVFVVIFLSMSALFCDQEQEQSGTKFRVLTTIAPLYSFTRNIAGDAAVVENLLSYGAGPHDYTLNPKDAKKIAEADLIIKNGVDLEAWLDRRMSTEGNFTGAGGTVVVDSSRGVELVSNDPHIWLSPLNAIIQTRNIRDALADADPANREVYKINAEAYISRLENLDRYIREAFHTLKKREFVAFHSAFVYFARDYGLKQSAVIQENPEAGPSPRHIADVIRIIRAGNMNSVFSEYGARHRIVDSLAGDLDLKVYSLDTLESGVLSADWYEERMRYNISLFKKALTEE
jgi:ABC-type Zn uptake system ZnuABC Zn-binding protein ZnuA